MQIIAVCGLTLIIHRANTMTDDLQPNGEVVTQIPTVRKDLNTTKLTSFLYLNENRVYSTVQVKQILEDLSQPFDPELIYWKPQVTSKDKKSAMCAAYADPRAYSDRLNEIVGPGGWSRQFEVYIATGMVKEKKTWKDGASTSNLVSSSKVMMVSTVSVYGIGHHTSTGETWADDENAATATEAQAFKRACLPFGLGRYLYDLDTSGWIPLEDGRVKVPPTLPDWALPKYPCSDCKVNIYSVRIGNKDYTISDLVSRSREKYNRALCMECMQNLAKQIKEKAERVVGQPS